MSDKKRVGLELEVYQFECRSPVNGKKENFNIFVILEDGRIVVTTIAPAEVRGVERVLFVPFLMEGIPRNAYLGLIRAAKSRTLRPPSVMDLERVRRKEIFHRLAKSSTALVLFLLGSREPRLLEQVAA